MEYNKYFGFHFPIDLGLVIFFRKNCIPCTIIDIQQKEVGDNIFLEIVSTLNSLKRSLPSNERLGCLVDEKIEIFKLKTTQLSCRNTSTVWPAAIRTLWTRRSWRGSFSTLKRNRQKIRFLLFLKFWNLTLKKSGFYIFIFVLLFCTCCELLDFFNFYLICIKIISNLFFTFLWNLFLRLALVECSP